MREQIQRIPTPAFWFKRRASFGLWVNTIPESDYAVDVPNDTRMIWNTVSSLSSAGFCTKLRCYVGASAGSSQVKMALYADTNLAAQSAAVTVSATGYAEFPLLAGLPVIGGPWNIAVTADNANNPTGGKISAGQGKFANIAFASFPPATLPVETTLNRQIIVGMFV